MVVERSLGAIRRLPSVLALGAVVTAAILPAPAALAKGGSSPEVTVTGAASGSLVNGMVTIRNVDPNPTFASAIDVALDVRFPTGVTPPPLPAGHASGWYRVATVALSPARVPAAGIISIPYSIDTCAGQVAAYPGAKDMRSIARVVARRVGSARSLNYALPGPCPQCGNGIREAGEACDTGGRGSACCSASCQLAADGSACSDGNACTRSDVCVAGSCESSDPVTCGAMSQCHDAGVCNPATGTCSNPLKANGAACNDGNGCTQTDTCLSGTCRGANPVVCEAPGSCLEASCDPSTGTCDSQPRPDGSECMDDDTCTVGDACRAGECIPGAARDCDDHLTCTDDACDPTTGCGHSELPTCEGCDAVECAACGAACDDANAQCVAGCWEGFLGCVNGCTSTYCAPFCQVGLGQCIAACPSAEPCRQNCDSGNGCAVNCTEP